MIVYPAMDLMGGKAVRLSQGRFDCRTSYSASPADALERFAGAGAQWAHVVDLDGARAGRPVQHELIRSLAEGTSLKLQVAGGFRTRDQIGSMLDAAERVVVGSLAVDEPDLVQSLLAEFGCERLAIALDVKVEGGIPLVYTEGWTHRTGLSFYEIADRYPSARHFLVTDIRRDGMLAGPNLELLSTIHATRPGLALQASGGVAALGDLLALAEAGAAGAVVGKALWEGRIDPAEAIRACA